MSMNPLEKLLVGITAVSFIISPITCLSNYVLGEEQKKEAPWKEVKRVRDLGVEDMLNIGNTSYTGLVTICTRSDTKLEGYENIEYVDDNMYKVLENLANKFKDKKINFSWFEYRQLLDNGYSIGQIEKFMQEKWKIKISDLPVTIMYKDGKEFDRFTTGPKNGGPKPGRTWVEYFVYHCTLWINYNHLGAREPEDRQKEECYVLFEGRSFTNLELPNGSLKKGGWRAVDCD